MKKRTKLIVAIFVVLFFIIVINVFSILYIKSCLKPTRQFLQGEICDSGETYCEITPFVVDEGAYGKSTLIKLEENGIIKDANIVYYWNRILGGYSFYAGYYELPHQIDGQDISINQMLQWLATPENAHQDTVWVKLEEGDFARNFAREIAEVTTVKEDELLAYWNDETVVRSYMSEYPFLTEEMFDDDVKILLEGYLFPDTYEFFEYTNPDEITRRLLDRTLDIYEEYEQDFKNSKLSIHEIFTLASICQWESGNLEDSKVVAGVFLNRLENPDYEDIQVLGSTVTACYAFDLTKDECYSVGDTTKYTHSDNPYNTYTNAGLPPGPVCCPNEISIIAALNPDQSDGYYYFVANMCEGGTAFARTWSQHEVNIDRYYLACD